MAETSVLRSSASPQNASPLSATPQAKMSGPHPLVQVQMGSGGKPIIGGANQGPARSVVILPPKGARAPAPQLAQQQAAASAPVSPITSDQLLLCRHLVDKHFAELTASSPENTSAIDLAISTLDAIDGALAAANAARAQAAKPRPPAVVVTNPRAAAAPGATAPRRVMREQPAQVIDAPATDASAED